MLTAAVPASFEAIAAGYDVPEISKYLVSFDELFKICQRLLLAK